MPSMRVSISVALRKRLTRPSSLAGSCDPIAGDTIVQVSSPNSGCAAVGGGAAEAPDFVGMWHLLWRLVAGFYRASLDARASFRLGDPTRVYHLIECVFGDRVRGQQDGVDLDTLLATIEFADARQRCSIRAAC